MTSKTKSLQQRAMSFLSTLVNTHQWNYAQAYDLVRDMLDEKWNERPVHETPAPQRYGWCVTGMYKKGHIGEFGPDEADYVLAVKTSAAQELEGSRVETSCVGCAQGWHRQTGYPDTSKHVHCPPRFIDCTAVKTSDKHERRVVQHASGWQEQMSTCVCGQPWPCSNNGATKPACSC